MDAEIEDLEGKTEKAKEGKEESKERTSLETEIDKQTAALAIKQKELEQFMKNDPKRVEELKSSIKEFKNIANSITDELYVAKKWILEKMNMDKEQFSQMFSIPQEIDYLD